MSIIDRLKGYSKVEGTAFHSDQEINNPTLLINAKIYTHSLLLTLFVSIISLIISLTSQNVIKL